MKTTLMLIAKKRCYQLLIIIVCFLNIKSIYSFVLLKKMNEYTQWFLVSYQLYTKTNKLVIFKKKYISDVTSCSCIDNNIFFYPQFTKAAQEILFHKRLALLQRTWKSWNVSPTYEWAWEYGVILFNLYKTVFENEFSLVTKEKKKIFFKNFSIETFLIYINSINNQILSLPLEAILQTIDLIAEAIPAFFQDYEIKPKEITIAWVKKYWWAIIITVVPLWLKVMIIFKNYYQYQRMGDFNNFMGQNQLMLNHEFANIQTTPLFSKSITQVDNKPDSVPHIQSSNHLSLQLTRAS
jgi:hypothetical protein